MMTLAEQQASGLPRMIRGTVVTQRRRCGKPNCHCADGARHPSLYLVQSQAGKVRQLCIPKALQDPVRQAVGEFQELQRLLREVSELEWTRFLARKG
jgi:hypothetical protein